MQDVMPAIRQIVDRTPLPARLFCPVCLYIRAEMQPQFFRWARRHRPDLLTDAYGGGLQAEPATQCRCVDAGEETRKQDRQEAHRRAVIMAQAGLPRRDGDRGRLTFDNFKRQTGVDSKKVAWTTDEQVEAVKDWLDRTGPPVLVLVGVTGCGKTHLLEAAIYAAAESGVTARYENARSYVVRMRATNKREEAESADEVLDWYRQTTMLALDDIGKGKITEFGLDEVSGLVDQRLSDGAWLLLAVNYTQSELRVRMGGGDDADRLASRMYDRGSGSVRVVYCKAGDYRTGR